MPSEPDTDRRSAGNRSTDKRNMEGGATPDRTNGARSREALCAELAQFDGKIESLTERMAQLDKAEADHASTYQSYLDALHIKRKAIELKLEQLDDADDSLWDDLWAGMEEVWDDFKMTFTRASEEFEAGQRLREPPPEAE
ncbi:MAG: hypothetical protein ACFB5Z_03855 [Elainellaceae cyanobacterium]